MSETDTPTPTVDPQPPVKKRGWPKGKPRGPRKPAIPEPVGAPESPTAPEPVVEASAKPPARKRRTRAKKIGVWVGKKFYHCVAAVYDEQREEVKLIGAAPGNELLVSTDSGKVIYESRGVPIIDRYDKNADVVDAAPPSQPWTLVPYPGGTTTGPLPVVTWGPTTTGTTTITSNREAELAKFNERRNAELLGLMGPEKQSVVG